MTMGDGQAKGWRDLIIVSPAARCYGADVF